MVARVVDELQPLPISHSQLGHWIKAKHAEALSNIPQQTEMWHNLSISRSCWQKRYNHYECVNSG